MVVGGGDAAFFFIWASVGLFGLEFGWVVCWNILGRALWEGLYWVFFCSRLRFEGRISFCVFIVVLFFYNTLYLVIDMLSWNLESKYF